MNGKITYRQQYTRCGKQRCRKCREGAGHGPYWYAYWSEKGRTISKYIGTKLPEYVDLAHQQPGEIEKEISTAITVQDIPQPVLRIHLLGQFRIEHRIGSDWRAVDSRTWHRRRARALLGCLLSSSGRRMGREQIMELLWPELDVDIASNRLNGAVHELRQILEPEIERPAASRLLRLEREVLELADSSQVWVDAEEFERLLKTANTSSDPETTERMLEEAASLYRGNYLLEELYAEWAAPRRDALQRGWVGLLLNLAELRARRGAFVSAIETLDRLRTTDPTNETALQRLMILLTQLDRRGEALHLYRQHARLLQREYESEPLPETVKLYETLLKGHIPPMPTTIKAQFSPTVHGTAPEIMPRVISATPQHTNIPFARPLFQPGRHNQSPLIGRDHELETMRQVMFAVEQVGAKKEKGNERKDTPKLYTVTSARAKQPHFLLLRGEAGIGKTRLAEELSIEAYTRGWAVAWSRSYEQERTIPYRPWTELLRTLLQGTPTFTELLDQSDASLTETTRPPSPLSPFKLERLRALLPELMPQTQQMPPLLSHEQERLHLWEATQGLLGTLGKIHPLLLVLDDLHWADDSSIELLTYLTHHVQDQRILLVATSRDGETPHQKLHALVTDLRREQAVVTLAIEPLTHSQIGTLLSHLPHDVIQSIQSQAAGNPFFAEELARYVGVIPFDGIIFPSGALEQHLPSSGSLASLTTKQAKGERETPASKQSNLPEPIAAVLERRLSRLSNNCQTLLSRAAVLGGSFELSQLLPMVSEHAEDTILDLLDEALHSGLLIEEGTGAYITYHFWHPLIISHLYERLSAARRALLHRKAADAIKSAHPAQQAKVATTIVYHLIKGGGNPSQIAFYAELAGSRADSLGAYSEALQYYLYAIQAMLGRDLNRWNILEEIETHQFPHRIASSVLTRQILPNPLHLCRLLERIAECSNVLGNFEDARTIYECILQLRTSKSFQLQIDPDTTCPEEKLKQEAQIQALLWREIGNTWVATGEYARAYACYERGKDVMSRAGVTSGAAWACLHMRYGSMLRLEGNYHEARRYLQEALEMLEQVVQPPTVALPASSTGKQQREAENLHQLTRTERALLGDPLEIGYAHERLGIVAASLGQMSEGLRHMETALHIFEQSELISEMARICGNLGAAYIMKGQLERARQYLQRSLGLAERAGDLPNMAFAMLNMGDVTHRAGDLLEAEMWYQRSLALAERINDRERMIGCLVEIATVQLDLGHIQEAAASLLRALSTGREIKNQRCINYALIGLGGLRITLATNEEIDAQTTENPSLARRQQLLFRARSTLQKAVSLEEIEIESITEGKYLLAQLYFLLGDSEAAERMALDTLQEAQEKETTRITVRLYRLLGQIMIARRRFEQANHYFEQSIQMCRQCGLRLEYARTLHVYGTTLAERNLPTVTTPPNYQQALSYLWEARSIFSSCHATRDLAWAEQTLNEFERRGAASQVRHSPM